MKKRGNGTHEVFGVELRRVTSIIGHLKRFGLEEWQASCAVDFMFREFLDPLKKGWMSLDQLKETNYAKAREAAMEESRKRMKSAQDLGRQVHAAIHHYYKSERDPDLIERLIALNPELRPGLRSFQSWEQMFHVDMIASEKTVFSFKMGYSGTLDLEAGVILPAEDYGTDAPVRHFVADFKTGSPDPVVVMQLAAYAWALEEMDRETIDGGIVVYLNADTGLPKWKVYKRPELEPAFKMFMTIKEFCELEDQWRKKEPEEEPLEAAIDPPSPSPPADSLSAENAPSGFSSTF